jgi:transcription-repair coupling factor (superfamily II helicase)
MKDLEIRGAGDLLGGEQSGFINEIGFETYQKILAEAIEELKDKEFKDLYTEAERNRGPRAFVKEVVIDTDFELLFPDDYVNNITERLNLYTKLNEIKDEPELLKFQKELEDRFGELPEEALDLLNSVRIKWIAIKMGLERVIMKKGVFIGYFISDQQSDFYQSTGFSNVLQFMQSNAQQVKMKEKQTRNGLRLLLNIDKVKSVGQVLAVLEKFSA